MSNKEIKEIGDREKRHYQQELTSVSARHYGSVSVSNGHLKQFLANLTLIEQQERSLEQALKALEDIKNYHDIHVNTSTKLMRVKNIAKSTLAEIRRTTP